MDIPNTLVQKKNGDKLSLKQNLAEVLAAWEEDGCLLLKQCTDVRPINDILSEDINSVDSVRKNIVLNDTVKAILFSARNDSFRIVFYQPYGELDKDVGQDTQWQRQAAIDKPTGVIVNHLGKEEAFKWIIDVDKGIRGKSGKEMVEMQANGGDIFLCSAWLRRSNPRPKEHSLPDAFLISIHYLWPGFSDVGKMDGPHGNKILEVSEGSCVRDGDYLLWQPEQRSGLG